MILKEISFNVPLDNILYDEVLLHLACNEENQEFLRIWESPQTFVVLGRAGKVEDDIKLDDVYKDGIPILRRRSGGGTVLQGKGCLNYSLILSKNNRPSLHDLHDSYQWILGMLLAALKTTGFNAVFKPLSDLAGANDLRKFCGNAQHRVKDCVLHHGTLLYDFDLSLIERYLKIPLQVPEYRAGRDHLEFVANLPLSRTTIQEMLKSCFRPLDSQDITEEELDCLQQFRIKHSDLVLFDKSTQQQTIRG